MEPSCPYGGNRGWPDLDRGGETWVVSLLFSLLPLFFSSFIFFFFLTIYREIGNWSVGLRYMEVHEVLGPDV